MRLNPNQTLNRIQSVVRQMRSVVDGLHPDDQAAILKQALLTIRPDLHEEEPVIADTDDMQQRILRAMQDGLKASDPSMVRAAMEWMAEHAGREYLKELTVNIVPYAVADKSLDRIIAECDEDRFAEIKSAVAKRQVA